MISLVDKLLPCMPKKIRNFLNCGYNYESMMFNVQSKAELIESPNFDIQDDLQLDLIEITMRQLFHHYLQICKLIYEEF